MGTEEPITTNKLTTIGKPTATEESNTEEQTTVVPKTQMMIIREQSTTTTTELLASTSTEKSNTTEEPIVISPTEKQPIKESVTNMFTTEESSNNPDTATMDGESFTKLTIEDSEHDLSTAETIQLEDIDLNETNEIYDNARVKPGLVDIVMQKLPISVKLPLSENLATSNGLPTAGSLPTADNIVFGLEELQPVVEPITEATYRTEKTVSRVVTEISV